MHFIANFDIFERGSAFAVNIFFFGFTTFHIHNHLTLLFQNQVVFFVFNINGDIREFALCLSFAIFEVKSAAGDLKVSICGGGRYDNLAGVFGWEGISGGGISFGADRIYDVMEDLKLFPENSIVKTKVMIVNFGGDEEIYARKLATDSRYPNRPCAADADTDAIS